MAKAHPQNAGLAVFIFVVLVGAGIAISAFFANAQRKELREAALGLAEETGLFFSQNLDQAILPLFSLAQFANELDMFRTLPEQIGVPGGGTNHSLPFLPPKAEGMPVTHRNVTGVCDDPALVKRYSRIASTIKKDAGMDGILVNLQFVPNGVVCLLYPLNNTQDFPPGIFMDNSGAVGHDLLTDPARKFIAEATVPSDKVVIAGPLTLRQCHDCDPTVEKAFIARLPITSESNYIQVNGEEYPRWGFAVALINWNELVERSGVYEVFHSEQMEFQLTRTDFILNVEENIFEEKLVILAESSAFDTNSDTQVSTALPTTNNEWEITVSYCTTGMCVPWFPWSVGACLIVSFCMSMLVYTIFSQKQLHSDALAEKSNVIAENAQKAAKSERELTDFIAHEVRNPIAAALSACSFVSASVNEAEPLVDQESQGCVRDDVRIIEASLQFVNDLLRSMLDLHRARSEQLMLEYSPTDMQRDVLEPVATMLYRRDESFEVIVECPENLMVSVDRLRLKQIVLNLARNSAKFVENGFVRLRAETTSRGVVIYVEDSGPGIPENKRNTLFAKFQESLDELSQGTGIGLSLCAKLIDLMGGSIELDNSYHSSDWR
jgi:sensor domain CHASE-containing protein